MSDQRPPRLVGGERATLHALLQYQRESLVRKVSDVDENDARRAIVPSGTTLLWLMKHMAWAEMLWVAHRFAGHDLADSTAGDTVQSGDTLAAAIDEYRATWIRVDEIAADAPSLDDPCLRLGDDSPVNLRWVLMHLLEETARHAGHADIIRELIDGETGR